MCVDPRTAALQGGADAGLHVFTSSRLHVFRMSMHYIIRQV
jgi:hypothetical protein